jgi:predicted acyl esterase
MASAAHPRWIRHSNTSENPADATDLVAATQTIHHAATHPSVLVLPLIGEV